TDNAEASIGVFFNDNDSRNLSERLLGKKQTSNYAKIFAIIRVLEIVNEKSDIIIFTDSTYVINCYNVKNPKPIFDLVDRMNDLIKVCKGKTYFKYVKGHSSSTEMSMQID
ncbi:2244_t:CDS:1, partial [Gigaspora rosea]